MLVHHEVSRHVDETYHLKQALLFWLFNGEFKVSSGTVEWYRSSCGTDFDHSEMASPVKIELRRTLFPLLSRTSFCADGL